ADVVRDIDVFESAGQKAARLRGQLRDVLRDDATGRIPWRVHPKYARGRFCVEVNLFAHDGKPTLILWYAKAEPGVQVSGAVEFVIQLCDCGDEFGRRGWWGHADLALDMQGEAPGSGRRTRARRPSPGASAGSYSRRVPVCTFTVTCGGQKKKPGSQTLSS